MITFEMFSIKQKVMNKYRFFCAKHDLCRPLCINTIHPPSKILRLLSKTKICFTTPDDELKTYVRNQVWSGPLIHCFISPFCRLSSQIKGEKCSNKQRKTFLLNVSMQKLDWNWVSNNFKKFWKFTVKFRELFRDLLCFDQGESYGRVGVGGD